MSKRKTKKVEEDIDSEEDDNDEEVAAPGTKKNRKGEDNDDASGRKSARQKDKADADDKQEKELGLWKEHYGNSLLYSVSSQIKGSAKIVGFDMDDTLIKTKSGKTFAVSRADWQWFTPEVPAKLQELHKNGWKVVIFTNQGGINGKNGWDGSKAKMIQGKINDVAKALGFPLQSFIATTDDMYRKPSTYMWTFMVDSCNDGIKPDLKTSLYVGDAAGRPAGWAPGHKKDFSCSDRKFAFNIGCGFQTPEQFFLGGKPERFDWDAMDPTSIPTSGEICEGGVKSLTSNSQEIICMVGFPASGKSTFSKTYLLPKGYVHVNRDTLKTPAKCLQVTQNSLKAGKSVVIDNTNPDKDSRAPYISAARAAGIPIRCFWMQSTEMLAKHLNLFRERITNGESAHVPRIGYAMFNKKFTPPTTAEGFDEVKKINFIASFGPDVDKSLFMQYA